MYKKFLLVFLQLGGLALANSPSDEALSLTSSPCEIGQLATSGRRYAQTMYVKRPAVLSELMKECSRRFGYITVAEFDRDVFAKLEALKCPIAEIVSPHLPEFPKPPIPEPETKEPGWVVCVSSLLKK